MNKDQPLKNTNIYLHLRKKKFEEENNFGKKKQANSIQQKSQNI